MYAYCRRAVQWMDERSRRDERDPALLRKTGRADRRCRRSTAGLRITEMSVLSQLARPRKPGDDRVAGGLDADAAPGTANLRQDRRTRAGYPAKFRAARANSSPTRMRISAAPIGSAAIHPDIRAGWAIDSISHGVSWPNRLSGVDDGNLSSAHLRFSWCKLIEDLGYQYEFISYLDTLEGRTDLSARFRIIRLPQSIRLSESGRPARSGTLFRRADCWSRIRCVAFSPETGRGRRAGALDDLFGLVRNESEGYLNGQTITEVDAENFQKPFTERLHA